ncbi:MAG: DUF3298 domain-containing protein [Flavobacteriaceae bacterium]
MKRNIGILLFAFLFVGCKDNSTLSYTEEIFEQKISGNCYELSCPSAKLEIILFDTENQVSDSINKKIFEHFKEVLSFEEPYMAKNYDELLKSFLDSYEKLREEFPDDAIGWEAKGKSEISFQNEKIINLKTEYYLYTGGAHGNSGVHSFFFDLKTGKNLSIEDVFANLNEFNFFAEKKFREAYHIKPEASINTTGFMFEDDVFHLPQTVLFTKKGVLLIYNSYEIASYADGTQELLIPFEEVKSFLNAKFI